MQLTEQGAVIHISKEVVVCCMLSCKHAVFTIVDQPTGYNLVCGLEAGVVVNNYVGSVVTVPTEKCPAFEIANVIKQYLTGRIN